MLCFAAFGLQGRLRLQEHAANIHNIFEIRCSKSKKVAIRMKNAFVRGLGEYFIDRVEALSPDLD
jgi:hypothetical protein